MSEISSDVATEVLVKCARHCCLCRRFKPTLLQVHHIKPRAEGGSNEFSNLTALCIVCHSSVHTKTPFTRRFSFEELAGQRDAVIKMVAEGKLIEPDESGTLSEQLVYESTVSRLSSEAIEVLINAARSDNGLILYQKMIGGCNLRAGSKDFIDDLSSPRDIARYESVLDELENSSLIKATNYKNELFTVTNAGYLTADELMAEMTVK